MAGDEFFFWGGGSVMKKWPGVFIQGKLFGG